MSKSNLRLLFTGFFIFLSQPLFAVQIKGHVLNTVRDDEGLKVIVESNELVKENPKKQLKKKKTHVLYMQGQNEKFVENEALLNVAKDKKQLVLFVAKKD